MSSSEILFQNGLQDLIKGIRANKKDTSVFISKSVVEIKNELKSSDPYIKAEDVSKLYIYIYCFDLMYICYIYDEI